MKLLDRYLRAVGQFLPGAQKDDILKELSANLQSQVEDREAELGRPLDEAEQAAILQQLGNPYVVAGRYHQCQRSLAFGRQLIGPVLFHLYEKVLCLNLGVSLVVILGILVGLGLFDHAITFDTLTNLGSHLLLQFTIITVIFTAVQSYLTRNQDRWDARHPDPLDAPAQPRPGPARVSRFESLAKVVASAIFLVWLDALHRSTGLNVALAQGGLTLGPVWGQLYFPIFLLLLAGLVQGVVNLLSPDWTSLRTAVSLGGGVAWLGCWIFLLVSGNWIVVLDGPVQPSAEALWALGKFNVWFFYSWLIVVVVMAVILAFELRAWARSQSNEGKASGRPAAVAAALCVAFSLAGSAAWADEQDWPTYNRDVLGWRHNPGEKAIDRSNAGKLQEKWRFPAKDSDLEIGVIHATPVVVDGYVYFGTATVEPTFYKLTPDGKVRWSYRNPALPRAAAPAKGEKERAARFASNAGGIFTSALVTKDSVYFGDMEGWFYALDRKTGKERWKINTRAKEFPGAHPINLFFASPILAGDKLIVAGGTLEQVVAAFPGYKGCTGRGYVMALDPATGKIAWKYDVGPKPQPLVPPVKIKDSWGEHTFHFGPATSSVWSTPSFDEKSGTVFFGTDVNTAPRRPTDNDARLHTRESCAVVALDVRTGAEKWVRQITPADVWTNAMRSYDPKEGRYKDQSIGDTPKVYTIPVKGTPTKVVGVGSKNGGFYVLNTADGTILDHTPIYTGRPTYPLSPKPDPRMLALPSCIGGLQTGCATDGKTVFTNGIDALRLASQEKPADSAVPPTGGRVVALSLDTRAERWRHERPKVASLGGPKPKPIYTDVGDPVASGVAVANGVVYFTTVASGKLVALDAATGAVLKEVELGPVWSGPSVSRGRVYVGTGNTQFTPGDFEAYFPKKYTGVLYSFGLPGEDEVSRLGAGKE